MTTQQYHLHTAASLGGSASQLAAYPADTADQRIIRCETCDPMMTVAMPNIVNRSESLDRRALIKALPDIACSSSPDLGAGGGNTCVEVSC